MVGTGQLPDTEQQIYRVLDDELYLVGTSEVPLASFHAGEILGGAELPRRYAGFSPCFRREAGAAGKDTQGMFRVHQFDKVEMFAFVEPGESPAEHERLLAIEEEILGALEIPYRVVNIAVTDLGASAAKKYDLEAWLPGQERFRELTSCSNTTDFQARRLEVRYRPGRGGGRAPRAHAQRDGRRGRPDDHRDRGEPPDRRRGRSTSPRSCIHTAHPCGWSLQRGSFRACLRSNSPASSPSATARSGTRMTPTGSSRS